MIRTRVLLVTAALCALSAQGVSAAKPIIGEPEGQYTFELTEAETPCGAFHIEVDDWGRPMQFPDSGGNAGQLFYTGKLTYTVTSVDSGRSIDVNISGPVKFLPDGTSVGAGPWLLWSPTKFILASGHIVMPNGDVDDPDAVLPNRQVDVCPILNPGA
jgi:hypothetical protein